ncbi:MAG: coenzyme F420 hydrogenase [Candidatus Lokiarchaeota archaeon]|nr:coenzyme F420 hydrogenase [Candidatus Lokiarchaeota archaeon]
MTEISTSKNNEVVPKSFEDLIQEVHLRGICGQCGGCVNFCSANEIVAIEMKEDGPPIYVNKDNCLHCGICYLICPQIHVLDEALYQKFNWKAPIGHWQKVLSIQASSQEIRNRATDGGVITGILNYLLEYNLIDGALVCKKKGPFQRESFFATTKEDLIEAEGSKFDFSSGTNQLSKYTTFTPTISGLKKVLDLDRTKIAVVGVPCQIHSIRKMQELKILPAHVIKYALGLFCYENFTFDEIGREKIEKKFNFSFENIIKMNLKDKVMFYFKDGSQINVSFEDMEEYMRPACSACGDFSNVFSDIAFGGLGSPDGYTTTMIRTNTGQKIYDGALKNGFILENEKINTSVRQSEKLAKIIAFAKMKNKRSINTLSEIMK